MLNFPKHLGKSAIWTGSRKAGRKIANIVSVDARKMTSMPTAVSEKDEVLFETNGCMGVATVNRPKALNSLNPNMCRLMITQYREWLQDDQVKVITLRGAGPKAFCAGGDVVSLAKAGKVGNIELGKEFFYTEYNLDYLIGTMSKPHVAIIDGITMGGGVGISVHGPFRVATEKTVFAMPETGIGLFPDVGGGHFLPRLPRHLGMYFALSGARMKGIDVWHAGIATHYVESPKLPAVMKSLAACKGGYEDVKAVLDSAHTVPMPFSLVPHLDTIDRCFSKKMVEEMLQALREEGDWGKGVAETIETMSPLSCKVTAEQLQRGAHLDLGQDLSMEYRLACRALRTHDFYEGIWARLIDKHNKPVWVPATLPEVTKETIDAHFAPLPDHEELVLV